MRRARSSRLRPALALGAKLDDELLGAVDDGVAARLEELARVVALALLVLAGLDVLAGGLGEDDLEVGVDVDLGDAQRDGLLDLVDGDAGAAVEDERQVAGQGLDLAQALEGQAGPVLGVDAVDVADAAGEEVDAQVGDGLALRGSASSPLAVMPSSVPPMPPTSASMEMPLLWASFTSSAVCSRLMSKLASCEPSYMTEVKPASMHLKTSS